MVPIERACQKRKKSDSVLWQKPFHPQKESKTECDNTKTPTKISITKWLRTDLGRPVGVSIVTQLVWLCMPSINALSLILQKIWSRLIACDRQTDRWTEERTDRRTSEFKCYPLSLKHEVKNDQLHVCWENIYLSSFYKFNYRLFLWYFYPLLNGAWVASKTSVSDDLEP